MDNNKPNSGDLLISEPYMADDNFRLTVVFISRSY